MSVELKDVYEYLGVKPEDINSIDDLKSKFEPTFVRRDQAVKDPEIVSKVTGKLTGSLRTAILSTAKELEVEIGDDEIKDKKVEEIAKILGSKAKEKITALDKRASSNNPDDINKEWESKYTKLEKKFKDTESLLNTTKSQFETESALWATEKKSIAFNNRHKDALSKVRFKTGITDLEMKGFNAIINEKYKHEFDESGNIFPTDAKGNRISNPKVAGTFMDFEDIYNMEANELKLVALAPTQQQQQRVIHQPPPVTSGDDTKKGRVLAKDRAGFKPMG